MIINQYWLSVGDHGASGDELNLIDAVTYGVEQGSFDIGNVVRGERRTLSAKLSIMGPTRAAVIDACRAIERKLEQAREQAGHWGNKASVSFGNQLADSGRMAFWDVWNGELGWSADGIFPTQSGYALTGVPFSLSVEQHPRGPAVLAGNYTISGTNPTIYISNVDTDVPALVKIVVKDSGSSPINGIHLARMARTPLLSTEFVPLLEVTPSGSGSSYADSSASGGSCARARAAAATPGTTIGSSYSPAPWVEIGRVSKPAGASATQDLFDIYLRGRDTAGQVGVPTSFTAQPANITRIDANKKSFGSGVSGQGSDSILWPVVWNQPTGSGNALFLVCTSTSTSPSWPTLTDWGAPAATTSNASGSIALYKILGAATRSGVEPYLPTAASGLATVTTLEYSGVASQDNITTGSSFLTSTNNNLLELAVVMVANGGTTNGWGTAIESLDTHDVPGSSVSIYDRADPSGGLVSNSTTGSPALIMASFKGTTRNAGNVPAGAWTFQLSASAGQFQSQATPPVTLNLSVLPSAGATNALNIAGSVALNWVAPAALPSGATYTLFWSGPAGGSAASGAIPGLSGTSYTFNYVANSRGSGYIAPKSTSGTAPTQPSYPAEFRALIGLKSGTIVQALTPVPAALSSNRFEDLYLGTAALPPQVRSEDGSSPDWVIIIQGRAQSGFQQYLDADLVYLLPHREPQSRIRFMDSSGAFGTLATGRTWVIESSRWGLQSKVTLLDGSGNEVGSVTPSGPFYLGPGDNLLLLKLLAANLASDITNQSASVTITYWPRAASLFGL